MPFGGNMSQQAKPFSKGQMYALGAQITPSTATGNFTGFHVCLAPHVSGMTPPLPGDSNHLWHWSTDMSLLK